MVIRWKHLKSKYRISHFVFAFEYHFINYRLLFLRKYTARSNAFPSFTAGRKMEGINLRSSNNYNYIKEFVN